MGNETSMSSASAGKLLRVRRSAGQPKNGVVISTTGAMRLVSSESGGTIATAAASGSSRCETPWATRYKRPAGHDGIDSLYG